ncbi:MAG: anti-sigma factor RsbA family regulatory protein [Micromonosporaceae bacterium]
MANVVPMAAGRPGLLHQGCVYRSDDEFLAMAVPFIEEGLAQGEPVLAATTSANLDLLGGALGPGVSGLDLVESAYFGHRPPQRVAAFDRYLKRHADRPGRACILAEPVWSGRSERDIQAWTRMEAMLNLIFADASMWMICPYDARMVREDIVADAYRTHPSFARGADAEASAEYLDPIAFASGLGAPALPEPPGTAQRLVFGGDMAKLHQFITAAASGLPHDHAALFVTAAAEAATYLQDGGGDVALAVWQRLGTIVCDLRAASREFTDPVLGMRPPSIEHPRSGDGLWLARQICERVEMSSMPDGARIQLHMSSARTLV